MEGCGNGCTHRDDEPHDDPAPMDGVEDEDDDLDGDRRREPGVDPQEPDDDEDDTWGDPDI